MKGSRSNRLTLSVFSVMFVAAGFFVSLSVYASNFIWPDASELTEQYASYDALANGTAVEAPILEAIVPEVVATVAQPKSPVTGSAVAILTSLPGPSIKPADRTLIPLDTPPFGSPLRRENDIADLAPAPTAPKVPSNSAAARDDSQIFAAYSLGTAEVGAPTATTPVFDMGRATETSTLAAKDQHDADYDLDMRVAALAQTVTVPIAKPTPADLFVLADDAPAPLTEAVFAMAETIPAIVSIWPQKVDHDAVLAVSRAMDTPDTDLAPTINGAIAEPQLQKSPDTMATPDLQLAAMTGDLQSPPLNPSLLKVDEELARDIAKILAATPTPLPSTQGLLETAGAAPEASPRPMRRGQLPQVISVWPQNVDHKSVLAVSLAIDTPDTDVAPAINTAIAQPQVQKTPDAIAAPDLQLAAMTTDLQMPPTIASVLKVDEGLARDLTEALAEVPTLLPSAPVLPETAATYAAPKASPRPMRRIQRARKPTPPATQAVAPRPSVSQQDAADVIPASAPAPAPILPVDGRSRISVVGVFQTDTAAWALLELSDGRIIKATKGTQLDGMSVSRIRGNKIWIRNGGSEKGLTTGQVIALD